MGREKKVLGRTGETIAVKYLKRKGYKIHFTNYKTPFGELDIVGRNRDYTVFVEVKTRSTSSLGPPSLSVDHIKKRHLIKNALFYLKQRRLVNSLWRIDVVSVKLSPEWEIEQIEHIENAVTGEDYY